MQYKYSPKCVIFTEVDNQSMTWWAAVTRTNLIIFDNHILACLTWFGFLWRLYSNLDTISSCWIYRYTELISSL